MAKIDLAPFLRINGFFPLNPVDREFAQLMGDLLKQEKLSLPILRAIQAGYSRGTLDSLTISIMNLVDFSETTITKALNFLEYVEQIMTTEGVFIDPESVMAALEEVISEDLQDLQNPLPGQDLSAGV